MLPFNLKTYDVGKVRGIAGAIAEDLERVRQMDPTDLGVVEVYSPSSQADRLVAVDYTTSHMVLGRNEKWDSFELPYLSKDECTDALNGVFADAVGQMEDNVEMQRVLFDGGVASLSSFANALANEGVGRLSVLAFDEVMKDVVYKTLIDFKKTILAAPWLLRVVEDCWRSLLECCMTFLFGPSYSRHRRRARIALGLSVGVVALGLSSS